MRTDEEGEAGEDHNSRRDREEPDQNHSRVSVCLGSETLTDQLHWLGGGCFRALR